MRPTKDADGKYLDVVAAGEDFYNGLCVPTIAGISGGRYVMAGWTWLKAWGGTLVVHEMVQKDNGRIGTKWMDELIPATTGDAINVSGHDEETTVVPGSSFLVTFDVQPGHTEDSRLALNLYPEADKGVQNSCSWSIIDRGARVHYSGTGSKHAREKSLREGGEPHRGGNDAIEKLMDTDRPFKVRMVVKYSPKYDGSIIDTEIAGCRTMITYREKLKTGRLKFDVKGMSVSNVSISPLAD